MRRVDARTCTAWLPARMCIRKESVQERRGTQAIGLQAREGEGADKRCNSTFTYKSSAGGEPHGSYPNISNGIVPRGANTAAVLAGAVAESRIDDRSAHGSCVSHSRQDRSAFALNSCSLQPPDLASICAPRPTRLAVSHQQQQPAAKGAPSHSFNPASMISRSQ